MRSVLNTSLLPEAELSGIGVVGYAEQTVRFPTREEGGSGSRWREDDSMVDVLTVESQDTIFPTCGMKIREKRRTSRDHLLNAIVASLDIRNNE
jgi:hypothetical protein